MFQEELKIILSILSILLARHRLTGRRWVCSFVRVYLRSSVVPISFVSYEIVK